MHKSALVALLAAILLAPTIQAHVAATPTEAEDHVLQDEWTDNGVWDGFDILDVYVREVDHGQAGAGIVVRWGLYGGSSAGYITEHRVTLEFDNAETVQWTSTDNGQTWTGPGEILGVTYEPEEDIPVVNLQFQGFVSYDALGAGVGSSLDGAVATAYADDLVVDVAPGGYHLYGVEINDPTAAPDSVRLIDSLVLDGPDRYTKSNLTLVDGTLTVQVQNLIAASGQHVFVTTSLEPEGEGHEHDEDGNHVSGQEAEAGEDLVFTMEVGDFNGVAQVFVTTDLGGKETFWLASDGTVSTEPLTSEEEGVDTPAVPLAVVGLAMLALAARRR